MEDRTVSMAVGLHAAEKIRPEVQEVAATEGRPATAGIQEQMGIV